MRAIEFLTESRKRMYQYIKSIVPTWPDYIVKDWLYPGFSRYNDKTKRELLLMLNREGLNRNTQWQLVPNMKFTMDIWTSHTLKKLQGRAGGLSDMGMDIPRDAERHATQARLAQQQGGVRSEPVILIKRPDGYELLEGWHRTIQHFHKFPDGYTGPAYVAVAQSKQGVAEGLNEFAPGKGGFGPFKVYISNEFIEEFPTFDQAKEEIDFLRTADPKSFDADWKIIDGTGKTVWQHDPGEAIDAMRMRRKIQFNKPDNKGVAEGKDFDRCFDQACKLYDQAVNKNLKPKLVQVADFQGDGNGADARWMKLPQHVWQHYVVIVGDQVLDPTAKQFGDSMPTQYQVSDLDRLWGKQYQIRPRQGVAEGLEFFSMPLRMSEYRGKHHPATNEPYDAKFKFSGDLKDRVHSLLDAGTKPTLLQVNPRHLLATQDWLSTQGGGKPAFATMKQHPVVLQKNNKLYILDGHHRSADAHKSGTPIQVYLFKDEL